MNIFKRISPKNRILAQAEGIADEVMRLDTKYSGYSDQDLKNESDQILEYIANDNPVDDKLVEALAIIREVVYRVHNKKAFRVQLIGAIIVYFGDFAEMMTGEGKTLTLVLVAYLNALYKKGVHMVTVNEYLVSVGAEFATPVMNFLNMSVGTITANMNEYEKRVNYGCDVTYTTNSELGFDYLRDNMVTNYDNKVQRGLWFAIVDEGDSVLIDEARTPLIISGEPQEEVGNYVKADRFVKTLTSEDYTLDPESQAIALTEKGVKKAEEYFKLEPYYSFENSDLIHKTNNALRANFTFFNGREYIVKKDEDGEDVIALVDQSTGRIMEGRSYSAGLQQAIQAKEYIKIEPENLTVATITYQSLFRLYKKLAAVSGTAITEAEEFLNIYNMVVVTIPTNKPIARIDHPDYIFDNKRTKWKYVVADIIRRYEKGQPVLVGTSSVEDSEILHRLLDKVNIPHEVLNAKNHAREAEIVALAGQYKAVTIATNMAGRGTDIKVAPECLALGGLYVIGTERADSRRIDNQLRGRAGRQGDVGESRFFISMEDTLFSRFATDNLETADDKLSEDVISTKFFTRLLNNTQKKVESVNYDTRKNLIDYDYVLSNQRELIYKQRDSILTSKNNKDVLFKMLDIVIDEILYRSHNKPNTDIIDTRLLYDNAVTFIFQDPELFDITPYNNIGNDLIKYRLKDDVVKFLNHKEELMTEPIFNQLISEMMISNIDHEWTKHLDITQKVREGVSLRAYEQKAPLNIYVQDSDELFSELKFNVAWNTVIGVCKINYIHPKQEETFDLSEDSIVLNEDFNELFDEAIIDEKQGEENISSDVAENPDESVIDTDNRIAESTLEQVQNLFPDDEFIKEIYQTQENFDVKQYESEPELINENVSSLVEENNPIFPLTPEIIDEGDLEFTDHNIIFYDEDKQNVDDFILSYTPDEPKNDIFIPLQKDNDEPEMYENLPASYDEPTYFTELKPEELAEKKNTIFNTAWRFNPLSVINQNEETNTLINVHKDKKSAIDK
nr:preprotein translocase subunit SecA [Ureaplasma canigenitalium]